MKSKEIELSKVIGLVTSEKGNRMSNHNRGASESDLRQVGTRSSKKLQFAC